MQAGQELLIPAASQNNKKTSIGDHDSRADNCSRTVHFEPERIVIMRRVCGVSMRVTIPINRYNGIAVRLPNLAESRRAFQIMLVHPDPDLCVALYESPNPLMVDAAISEWTQYFGLPALEDASYAPDSNLAVEEGEPCAPPKETPLLVHGLAMGPARSVRRRGASLSKRRPRLYARRKAGEASRMDAVYGNEREIIARN